MTRPATATAAIGACARGQLRAASIAAPAGRLRARMARQAAASRKKGCGADDEHVREVVAVGANLDEIHCPADAARGGPVVHSQAVEQVAAPSADHQGTAHCDSGQAPPTAQDGYSDAQQPEVEHVEQRTRDGLGIPAADRGSGKQIAARVDMCRGDVPPGPPFGRLVHHDDRRQRSEHQQPLPEPVLVFHLTHSARRGRDPVLAGAFPQLYGRGRQASACRLDGPAVMRRGGVTHACPPPGRQAPAGPGRLPVVLSPLPVIPL